MEKLPYKKINHFQELMKTLPDKPITDVKNFTDEEFNICLNKLFDEAKKFPKNKNQLSYEYISYKVNQILDDENLKRDNKN